MKITKIISDRHFNTWPSWQIVYEWEDEIAKNLNIPIANSPNQPRKTPKGFLKRYARKLFRNDLSRNSLQEQSGDKFIYFEMHPKNYASFSNADAAIPVIIDFWKKEKVEGFRKYYKNCSHLLVTSLEVLNFLKKENFANQLVHFPMSLPDKYKLSEGDHFNKEYDVILPGRSNPVLLKYFEKYREKHPHVEYIFREEKNGRFSYYSNKKGVLGDFKSRESYSKLLSMAKVAFYATPGMDDEKGRTGGFNPVTPRLFEILAAGCEVIMRYPENEEAEFFELASLAPSALSYDLFEKQMDEALRNPAPVKRNSTYLNKHYTSKRLDILKSIE